MLKELSKQNDKWKQIAFSICKDYDLSNDLVQKMYWKLKDNKVEDYLKHTEGQKIQYIRNCIRFLFLDHVRKKKNIRLEELHYVQDNTPTFEPNDEQQKYLDEFNKLDWVSREYILEKVTGNSYRSIGDRYNTNYMYVYKQTTKGLEQIRKLNK